MHLIPASSPHFHLLVSVFPSVGLVFILGLYVTALIIGNEGLTRTGLVLFALLGLLAYPTYVSGDHAQELFAQDPKISQDLMSTHLGWGVVALALLALTGTTALIELWRQRRSGQFSMNALHLVLGLAIVTLGFMVVV